MMQFNALVPIKSSGCLFPYPGWLGSVRLTVLAQVEQSSFPKAQIRLGQRMSLKVLIPKEHSRHLKVQAGLGR
jgi:hypothetical protein